MHRSIDWPFPRWCMLLHRTKRMMSAFARTTWLCKLAENREHGCYYYFDTFKNVIYCQIEYYKVYKMNEYKTTSVVSESCKPSTGKKTGFFVAMNITMMSANGGSIHSWIEFIRFEFSLKTELQQYLASFLFLFFLFIYLNSAFVFIFSFSFWHPFLSIL